MCQIIVGADGNSFLKDAYNEHFSTIKDKKS